MTCGPTSGYTVLMTENDNGGTVERKVSTDKKTRKMFRRLEKFVDEEGQGKKVIDFYNAETRRHFATVVSPEHFEALLDQNRELDQLLREAMNTIEVLEDDNALLGIIDAMNEVLQGRANADEAELFDQDAVTDFPPGETADSQWTWTGGTVGVSAPILHPFNPFTADVAAAHTESDFFGYKPEDFR